MDSNIQRNGFLNFLVLTAATVVAAFLASYTGLATAAAGTAFLAMGCLISALSFFRMRLKSRERWERLEYDEMKRQRQDTTLFKDSGEDTFQARQLRRQFDRYFVPLFTAVFCLAQGFAAYYLWQNLPNLHAPVREQAALAMVAFSTFSLVLFLLGKYSTGLARSPQGSLLRPGSAYLLLGSAVSLLIVLTGMAIWLRSPGLDLLAARILTIVLALTAVELLINLILEIYRPRGGDLDERPMYESRLVGLLSQPGGLVTTVAQALDYQFGFRVSDTWFYKFLEKAFAWLVLLQLGILLLSTSFVVLEPGELGLHERFGRLSANRGVMQSGLHFKLPWPIDRVHRHRANEIRSIAVGCAIEEHDEAHRTVIWTEHHADEEDVNFLVASNDEGDTPDQDETVPVNLLVASIPVQYYVSDLESWVYRHRDPEKLMEDLTYREVVRYLVSVDLMDIMSVGRLHASQQLTERIQQAADRAGLGAEIIFVGLQDMHPPVGDEQIKVAAAFEEVNGAMQAKEATILSAEAEAAETIPLARAEAAKLRSEAEAYRLERVALAKATAELYRNQMAAWHTAPGIVDNRIYFSALGDYFRDARKYLITPENADHTYIMNLEDEIAYDLLGARPEEP